MAPLRPILTLLGGLCALVAPACSSGSSDAGPAARNLILISVDTLRSDRLGSYGFERGTSPTLDGLARDGVRFTSVTSTSPWTLPAHATLLTGLYPSRHGVKSHERFLQEHVVTLAEAFRARGHQTAGIVNSHNLSPRYGLAAGFEHFDYVKEDVARRAPTHVERNALAWLEGRPRPAAAEEHPPAVARELHDVPRRADEPFFLFLHYYDVHSDYASLPRYEAELVPPYDGLADGTTAQCMEVRAGRLSFSATDGVHLDRLYQAGIRQWDDGLARLLAKLDELGLRDDTLIVITSDHGEEFLEHGGVLHGRTQYEEVLRVPWILAGPGVPQGVEIDTTVSLVDVMPTLLSLFDLPSPPGLDGLDVGALFRGGGGARFEERFLFGEADHNNEAGNDITRSIRYRDYKYVLDRASGEAALYDLARDPDESEDAAAEHPELVELLSGRLDEFLSLKAAGGELPALSDEDRTLLESLGYLGGG